MSTAAGRKKGQERLIDLFKEERVTVISGIVDVHFMDFHRAALANGMKMIGTRHEVASVMVAEAASRMSGRPQVAMAAYGPGAANMVGGVVTANKENVPLIVLVSGRGFNTRNVVRSGKFQYWPQLEVFRHITKWAAVVPGIKQLDEVVREAFRHATTGTPGPVYIEVPVDVMWGESDFPAPLPPEAYRTVTPQAAADAVIDQAADLLAQARFPVILAGQGIHVSRTHKDLERLAKILKCPVITTFGGRGALPENDPQTLIFGFAGANRACSEADVVLAVGTSIGESAMCGEPPRWGTYAQQKWIHLERDPSKCHINRFADVSVVGDLRSTLSLLADAMEMHGLFEAPLQLAECRAEQDKWRAAIAANTHEGNPIDPGRAMLELRAAIPDDAVIAKDGGCTGIWEMCLFEKRSCDFLSSSHMGHLGSALPYAIGAKLVVGDERQVVVISGDGGLGFQFMEFETAVREGLAITVIVNYDQHWGMELMDFYKGPESIDECPGTRMALTRYDKMAEAIGGHGEFVEQIEELRPAVERALQSGQPAIVQIMTDVGINANMEKLPAVDEYLSIYYLEGNMNYGTVEEV